MIGLEVADRVARLTIDRPAKRNAVTGAMWASLQAHLTTVDAGDNLAAVVVRGAGSSFSAGADLSELRGPDRGHVAAVRELAESTVASLRSLAPPTLAAIDGPCLGAGASLALACDVRICSPRSTFGVPSLRHGLLYEEAHLRRLVQGVGAGAAGLLLYGGELWTADDAVRYGLVQRCGTDLDEEVDRIVGVLRGAPTDAVVGTAAAIRGVDRWTCS